MKENRTKTILVEGYAHPKAGTPFKTTITCVIPDVEDAYDGHDDVELEDPIDDAIVENKWERFITETKYYLMKATVWAEDRDDGFIDIDGWALHLEASNGWKGDKPYCHVHLWKCTKDKDGFYPGGPVYHPENATIEIAGHVVQLTERGEGHLDYRPKDGDILTVKFNDRVVLVKFTRKQKWVWSRCHFCANVGCYPPGRADHEYSLWYCKCNHGDVHMQRRAGEKEYPCSDFAPETKEVLND